VSAAAYGMFKSESGLYAKTLFSAGYYDNKDTRYAMSHLVTGNYETDAVGGELELGLRKHVQFIDQITYNPYVSVAYDHLYQHSYDESDITWGNHYYSRQVDSLPISVGMRLDGNFATPLGRFMPTFKYAYLLETQKNRSVSMSPLSSPGCHCQIDGISAPENMQKLDLGLKAKLGEQTDLSANVMKKWTGDSSEVLGSISLDYKFLPNAIASSNEVLVNWTEDGEMYKGPWYVLAGLGYSSNDRTIHDDDSGLVSVKVAKEVSENIDLQVGASYQTGGRYKQSSLGLDALYMLSRKAVRPYFMAGLGYANNQNSLGSLSKSADSLMASVGLGLQYQINENFGLQAELKKVFSEATVPNDSGNLDRMVAANTVFGVSAIYKFATPKTSVPVEVLPDSQDIDRYTTKPAEPDIKTTRPDIETTPPDIIESKDICRPTVDRIEIREEALFDFDKSKIDGKNYHVLDKVAAIINRHSDAELILVIGHADRIGLDKYNQKLSERRANAVKKYLKEKGVKDLVIKSFGMGEKEPVVSCSNVKGKENLIKCLAPNRRVIIDIKGEESKSCN
jgi:OOP family OmpA-OmpF porin